VRLVEEVENGRTAADLEAVGRQDLQRGVVTVDMIVMVRMLWSLESAMRLLPTDSCETGDRTGAIREGIRGGSRGRCQL
jgi:hypothetical protein